MTESSPSIDETARKSHATALRRIALRGQNSVAAALSVSPTTISRHLSDEEDFSRSLKILAAAGLKVVPAEYQCFKPEMVAILLTLAKTHLKQLQCVSQLGFADDDDGE